MKNVYFLSDAHLGSRAIEHSRTHERRLVNFLDSIKHKAEAIYLLGDMFDFWYEFKNVVPKGFTRFLGKVSELTDSGVEVHFFTGNHDLWWSTMKKLNAFFEENPTSNLYVATFIIDFQEDLTINIVDCVVFPIFWIPDVYVNPSNNGNLQSAHCKYINDAVKRTKIPRNNPWDL